MTKQEIKSLEDIKAFIEYAIEKDMDGMSVLSTIGHDVGGLVRQERCFMPRSVGYKLFMDELRRKA